MQIHGFQKMTLLDFPGRVACTVFTGGCNLRCPFCHNALLVTELQKSDVIPTESVISYLEKRTKLLDGVAITGGEPLLQPDIASFIRKIKGMGYAVKLDTNGAYPAKLRDLIEEGLVDYVAMDVKNCREKYGATVGIPNFDISKIDESIRFLLAGKVDFEFRTTIVKEFHTVDDIKRLSEWIAGAPKYFLQNFTDSGNLIGENMHECSKETLSLMREAALKHVQSCETRGV
ncbi:MAG: anaerobic ribonucleoside-triphosphate reductase activating protein [Oscillospiraceae bacterium]|nr:anaerobic ribonucleoside-triphosphate reductase activating protein [Oscillospiraceae bacterium]